MVKSLFQNSKAALIFAGVTILGAVAMVGSQDDGGVVLKAVSAAEARRSQMESAVPPSPAPPPPSVFGDYVPPAVDSGAPATAPTPAPPMTAAPANVPEGRRAAGGAFNPANAPLSSSAIVGQTDEAEPQ